MDPMSTFPPLNYSERTDTTDSDHTVTNPPRTTGPTPTTSGAPFADYISSARSSLSTSDSSVTKRLSVSSSPDRVANYNYYDYQGSSGFNYTGHKIDMGGPTGRGMDTNGLAVQNASQGIQPVIPGVLPSSSAHLTPPFSSIDEIDPFVNPFQINSSLWAPPGAPNASLAAATSSAQRRHSVPATFGGGVLPNATPAPLGNAAPRTPGTASFSEQTPRTRASAPQQSQQQPPQQQPQSLLQAPIFAPTQTTRSAGSNQGSIGSIWGHRSSAGSVTSPLLGISGLAKGVSTSQVTSGGADLRDLGALRRASYDPSFSQVLNLPGIGPVTSVGSSPTAGPTAAPGPAVAVSPSQLPFTKGVPPNAPPLDYVQSFDNPYGAQQQQKKKEEEQLLSRFNNMNLVSYQDQYSQAYEEANQYFHSPPPETLNLRRVLSYLNNQQLPNFPGGGPPGVRLVLACFKNARLDAFYIPAEVQQTMRALKVGDLIIMEADRGRDLGKVVQLDVTLQDARLLKLKHFRDQQAALEGSGNNNNNNNNAEKRPALHFPKPVVRFAYPNEVAQLMLKKTEEEKARNVCQLKVKSHNLVMTITDAEYQWDRRKLTFYYKSSGRIDFRDLVKELFKIYKTRIWMCKQPEPIAAV